MIQPAFEILNQKGTPMFFSDVFANIPTAGIVGRIFIRTDSPYGIYRDTGSTWEQIAGSGGGGISGSGAAGQVTFWTGASAVSGSNNLFFDNASGKFLVGTNNTTGAAKLQVTSATGDDHFRVWGATSPSIRIDNAVSGATQRFVMGLATATNNFIQGSAAGDICISTASASPLLFGMWQTINATEVMRISTANNLLIGTTTDAGQKLQVIGTARITGNVTINTISVGLGTSNISTNTAVGVSCISAVTTGIRNTAVGNSAGQSITGSDNTIIGASAGSNASLSGGLNTLLGSFAGQNITSGSRNVCLGHVTGRAIGAGVSNTYIGSAVVQSGTGSWNVAIGDVSGEGFSSATNNTAVGSLSMQKNTTGGNNVALGYSAGSQITGSLDNTITNNSIYIGFGTKALASNQTNQIVIGYNSTGLGSNTTIIGNSSTITSAIYGNLLLGTTTDAGFRLDVQGTSRYNLSGTSGAANGFLIYNGSTNNLRVLGNGEIRIGGSTFEAPIFQAFNNAATIDVNGYNIGFSSVSNNSQTTSSGGFFNVTGLTSTIASGHYNNLLFIRTFAPTSGTATFTNLHLRQTINQTGGANGITRGLHIQPTLTAAADWRSFEFDNSTGWGIYGVGSAPNYLNGNLNIASTSNPGQKLYVNGAVRIDGQTAATAGGSAGLHLILNLDGTNYKIALLNV